MKLASYNGLSRPDKEDCIQTLNQFTGHMNGMYTTGAIRGQNICLRTAKGNIAVLQIEIVDKTSGTITALMALYSP